MRLIKWFGNVEHLIQCSTPSTYSFEWLIGCFEAACSDYACRRLRYVKFMLKSSRLVVLKRNNQIFEKTIKTSGGTRLNMKFLSPFRFCFVKKIFSCRLTADLPENLFSLKMKPALAQNSENSPFQSSGYLKTVLVAQNIIQLSKRSSKCT